MIGRLASLALAAVTLVPAQGANEFPGRPTYQWDVELLSMDLNATGVLLPLGPGWSPILTELHIGESPNKASQGQAFAYQNMPNRVRPGSASKPQPGDPLFVQSFFDVFFDITITDVDPAVNFGGGPLDGLSFTFENNGPAHMQNAYMALFDPDMPNFGLIPPPESAPYIGHFNIEIPLGADLNANGESDKIKFTLAAHTVSDANRTFIVLPDGSVIDGFDSALDLSGAVVDESQDPPFGPITLVGPTTALSNLVIPESSAGGAGMGLALLVGMTWLRRRRIQR